MALPELFTNDATTTLAATIDASVTTITVASSTGFPAATTAAGQFRIRIENEYLTVTNVSGTTWTVSRGVEGSTAAGHASGTAVSHVLSADGLAKGYAPLDASVRVPAANLGTGTADSTTVLYGDRVFRTAPSGGGSGALTEGRVVISGTTHYAVPGMPPVGTVTTVTPVSTTTTLYACLVQQQVTFDAFALEVTAGGTAASLGRVGLYSCDAAWSNAALIVDGGTFAADSAGVKVLVLGTAVTLTTGRYLLAVRHDSAATLTLRRLNGPALMGGLSTFGSSPYIQQLSVTGGGSSALPSTLGTMSTSASNVGGSIIPMLRITAVG